MLYLAFRNIGNCGSEEKEAAEKIVSRYFSDNKAFVKKESVFSALLLSQMLKDIYDIKECHLKRNEKGKPYIENKNAWFNISHSGDMIFCIVADSEVGCDVQLMSGYKERVAERFFTEKEYNMLSSSENQQLDFTRLWCLKESYLKYLGQGLGGGLSSCDFSDFFKKDYFKKDGLYYRLFRIDNYIFALCSKEPETDFFFKEKGD